MTDNLRKEADRLANHVRTFYAPHSTYQADLHLSGSDEIYATIQKIRREWIEKAEKQIVHALESLNYKGKFSCYRNIKPNRWYKTWYILRHEDMKTICDCGDDENTARQITDLLNRATPTVNNTLDIVDENNAETEKQRLYDFVKNDITPLVIEQSGADSERARLCRLLYFVLRNRTVENWGPRDLTMADAMRLP